MNRKITVIIPAVVGMLESDLLEGIQIAAKRFDCDVIVLTNSCNTMEGTDINDSVIGEYNIFRLLKYYKSDGVILAAGRFHKEDIVQKLLDDISACGCPAVVLEHECDRFESIYPEQKKPVAEITKHLIEVHGFKDIYCLTGPEGSKEAEERLEAFRETMEKYGLPCSDDHTFYGDFWTNSAQEIADRIAARDLELPEAIVCTNDVMAVSLIEALKQYSIKVPDDIIVTGYDGDISTLITEPTVTTVCGIDKQLGEQAVCRLYHLMTGIKVNEPEFKTILRFGKSCGCENAVAKSGITPDLLYRELSFNRLHTELYMNDEFAMLSARVESLEELRDITSRHVHLIPRWKWIDICLCTDWCGDFDNYEEFRKEGYTDKMYLMLSKHGWHVELPCGYTFPTDLLLPSLQKKHDPVFTVFTPLQYGKQVFGYLAISYDDARDYYIGSALINWRNCVKNGLFILRKQLYIQHIRRKMDELSNYDVSSGLINKTGLLRLADDNFKMASSVQKVLILMSWRKTTIDNTGKVMNDNHLISNTLQLYSDSNCVPARISEKVFAVIMKYGSSAKNDSEQFMLRFEEMLQSIYKEKNVSRFPEIQYTWNILKNDTPFESVLSGAMRALEENLHSANENNDYTSKLRMIHKKLHKDPQDFRLPDTLAEELHISKSYFQLLYKQQFGIAFHSDLLNSQIGKACRLLRETSLKIYEIAEKCGFVNTTHFMKQFKAKVGVTPTQYRNSQKDTAADK
ncbi:MAG: substrate-binding domain-containing protein [Ruminococcus sp.]|nr:substrate-binding domain-containing protein [Ruminococcus sp.]